MGRAGYDCAMTLQAANDKAKAMSASVLMSARIADACAVVACDTACGCARVRRTSTFHPAGRVSKRSSMKVNVTRFVFASACMRNWTLILSVVVACTGCASYSLMPTPLIYAGAQGNKLFAEGDTDRSVPVELLYVTDRAPATAPDGPMPYTADRSRQLAFGSTSVEFGPDITWRALVTQSTTRQRSAAIELKLGKTAELGRFPSIPYEIVRTASGLSRAPAVTADHEAVRKRFQAELERRLATVARKEVVLFVHGVRNTFEDAVLTTGELCHFLGREFACVAFTWPAGENILGYGADRESAEFATEDLKKTIRMIADTQGVEKIHILAHSRGTDLAATAISELSVEAYVTRTTIARRFKIANIALMAPDLDFDVAPAKIWKVVSDPDLPYGDAPAPNFVAPSPEFHLTVYVSRSDKALATSGWLFGGAGRVGRLDVGMVSAESVTQARMLGGFDVIEVTETNCFVCHSYFVSNPRASSDLIAMLRYGLKPDDLGRALVEIQAPFWRLPSD